MKTAHIVIPSNEDLIKNQVTVEGKTYYPVALAEKDLKIIGIGESIPAHPDLNIRNSWLARLMSDVLVHLWAPQNANHWLLKLILYKRLHEETRGLINIPAVPIDRILQAYFDFHPEARKD